MSLRGHEVPEAISSDGWRLLRFARNDDGASTRSNLPRGQEIASFRPLSLLL